MAKATPTNTGDKRTSDKHEDLLSRIRDRYKVMAEYDRENRLCAQEDFRFLNVPGEQWEPHVKSARGNRPMYEFNKTRVFAKRIINAMRMARPAGKVRAAENGDKQTADVFDGLARNIFNTSDFDTIMDQAAEYQVASGMAGWRVNTKYSTTTAFDQDIRIEAIRNPFSLYCDPGAKDLLGRDALDWIITEKISKKSYELRYPDADAVDWEGEGAAFDDESDWDDGEFVRIVEYWWKEPYTKKIVQLSDGTAVDAEDLVDQQLDPSLTVVKEREVKCMRVKMCIASGDAVLEGPTEWAGEEIPLVRVFGEYVMVDGKPSWFGIVRFAKDAQRSYNVSRTAIAETIAMTPQGKWVGTFDNFQGIEKEVAEAHEKNFPFLAFKPDKKTGIIPSWMGGAQVPTGLANEAMMASDELKSIIGIFDASLGARSNEASGRAIQARQAQGDIATFNYQDNMSKGIRRTYEIVIDLMPRIYDTERIVRIIGQDQAEKFVQINAKKFNPETGKVDVINDLSRGTYDVVVTVGPNFATQRMEAMETYTQLAQANPQMWAIAGDLMMKNMDLPGSEQIADRMKFLLPPPVQQSLDQGAEIPPEVQMKMAQADQAMQAVQEQGQMVQQAATEAEGMKAEAEKAQTQVKVEIANLQKLKAEFDRDVAQQMQKFAEMQVRKDNDQVTQDGENEKAEMQLAMQTVMAEIRSMHADFMNQAMQTLVQLQQQTQPQVILHDPPVRKTGRMKKVNGEWIFDMQEIASETPIQ
jgi:hypothetical protein